jgi:large subunit ribosomal protein L30|tara:strand:- start:270 stop:458 length:189 start_codon:yes stop_codon:yes gene_type:complete
MAKQKEIIKVTLIKSLIGRTASQKGTVVGLGLKKIHHTVELQDTPEIRGMINAVNFLLKVES